MDINKKDDKSREQLESNKESTSSPFVFGWFSCAPRRLQCFNTIQWFLAFITLGSIFQSMVINGLVGVILQTLERRFNLPSTQSAWIHNSYDIATIPMLLIVSYVGATSHRPRWTAIGLTFLSLGCFLFTIPHFATPVYVPIGPSQDDGLCRNRTGADNTTVPEIESSLSGYLGVFILSRVFVGFGATPLYTLAATYLDDSVLKEKFSFYISIFYSGAVFGPAIGYIIGGFMLSKFTDFITVSEDEIGIGSDDPRWVGAWWVGFLIAGIALIFVIIPLSCFPRDLPGAADIRLQKKSEANMEATDEKEEITDYLQKKVTIKELPIFLKSLLTNWTYLFLSIFVSLDMFLINGFAGFGPKLMQTQFSLSSTFAGILFGIITVPGGAGGTITGGILIRKLKLTCTGIMKWEVCISLIIAILTPFYILHCPQAPFVGIDTDYESNSINNENPKCYQDCSCEDVPFNPICSVNNTRYYSACHAGCTDMVEDGIKHFYNCSCISMTDPSMVAASSQSCSGQDCRIFPLSITVLFIAMFLIFICQGMNISATMRCVSNSQKSMAIGVQWIFLRLLGSIPGPVVFGAVFESMCIQRAETSSGGQGACIYYDVPNLSYAMFGLCCSVKVVSFFVALLALKLYKPPKTEESTVQITADKNNPSLGYENNIPVLLPSSSDIIDSSPVTNGLPEMPNVGPYTNDTFEENAMTYL